MLAVAVLAFLTGDQQTLVICTLLSAVLGPVLVIFANNASGKRVSRKIDAVHNEIRPPSNGTTTGALLEAGMQFDRWALEELMEINRTLGRVAHGEVPDLPPQFDPPTRPQRKGLRNVD